MSIWINQRTCNWFRFSLKQIATQQNIKFGIQFFLFGFEITLFLKLELNKCISFFGHKNFYHKNTSINQKLLSANLFACRHCSFEKKNRIVRAHSTSNSLSNDSFVNHILWVQFLFSEKNALFHWNIWCIKFRFSGILIFRVVISSFSCFWYGCYSMRSKPNFLHFSPRHTRWKKPWTNFNLKKIL